MAKRKSIETNTNEEPHPQQNIVSQIIYLVLSVSVLGIIIYSFINGISNKSPTKSKRKKSKQELVDNISIIDLEELVELSQSNTNAFYIKFVDAFPNLYNALVSFEPELSDSEIKFCMYLKLGYSTKEIAIYTNSTIKSVESRKYRLKRKLKDDSDKNLLKQLNFSK